ncbi:MAG: hypothetical protein ACFB14_10090 [Leptolyngbyaceae cyanobacterium]
MIFENIKAKDSDAQAQSAKRLSLDWGKTSEAVTSRHMIAETSS